MLRASYKTAEELGGQRLYCLGSLLANISTEIAAAHGWRHSRAASGVAAGLVECSTWAAASIRAAGLSSRRWRLRWRLLPRSDSLHRHDRRHGGSLRRQRARPVAGSMPQHPVRVSWPASSADSGRQRLDGDFSELASGAAQRVPRGRLDRRLNGLTRRRWALSGSIERPRSI